MQLTALRRQVLELLWESGRPTGAYVHIEALTLTNSRPVGTPTVYRALEFWMSQGFVSEIESQNTYVACAHPERRHDCTFFICGDCGASFELEDERVEQLLVEEAANRLGFRVTRRVVELGAFTSDMKYESGTDWPNFFTHIPDVFERETDYKMILPRTEYHCARCAGHHGHVFKDGPRLTGERWCNNGVALTFPPA